MKFVAKHQKDLAKSILKPLSPKHHAILKLVRSNWGEDSAFKYLLSFSGHKHRNRVPKLYTPDDNEYEGTFKDLFARLLNKSIEHTPWSDKRFVGVELEVCGPKILRHQFIEKVHTLGVHVEGDGSLKTNMRLKCDEAGERYREELDPDRAFEISILMRQGNYAQLAKVLDFIRSNGGYVNPTCGLHVHLDQRHNMRDEAMRVYSTLQNAVAPLLSKLVDQSRLTPFGGRKNYAVTKRNIRDKYRAINFLPYARRRTIEVRLHHGTLDFAEIVNWIETLISVSEMKKMARPKKQKTWAETLTLLSISDEKKLILQTIASRKLAESTNALANVVEE